MKIIPILIVLVLATILGFQSAAQQDDYKIIVHPNSPVESLGKTLVSRMFLKKTTKWDHGQNLMPVDQGYSSPVRSVFSKQVHRKSVSAIRNYWQQQIYSGRAVPPPMKDTNQQVIRYVISNPGAIGYVTPEAKIGRAKVVELID